MRHSCCQFETLPAESDLTFAKRLRLTGRLGGRELEGTESALDAKLAWHFGRGSTVRTNHERQVFCSWVALHLGNASDRADGAVRPGDGDTHFDKLRALAA